jgi:hypothetical protein
MSFATQNIVPAGGLRMMYLVRLISQGDSIFQSQFDSAMID